LSEVGEVDEVDEVGSPPVHMPGDELDIPAVFGRIEQMLLDGPRRYTREQVAAEAGISRAEANKLWRALGFATVGDDEAVFTDGDVRALRAASELTQRLGADEELRTAITRLLGRTFAQLASFQGQLLIELVSTKPELLDSEDSVIGFVEEVVPLIESVQSYVWRRQMVAYFARFASHYGSEATVPGIRPVGVGFADMAGFTTLTRRATETDLRQVLEAFEALATEIVGACDGRIVKTIGDEILFVADTPAAAAEIALRLQEATESDELLPPLRVGVAAGPVVSRLGDVYGATVNIASRLTSICRPGWVLVDRGMAEELRGDEQFVLKPRRPESVRGYHHLRQWRLRRAETPSGAASVRTEPKRVRGRR
jgi:adenylate cyclase